MSLIRKASTSSLFSLKKTSGEGASPSTPRSPGWVRRVSGTLSSARRGSLLSYGQEDEHSTAPVAVTAVTEVRPRPPRPALDERPRYELRDEGVTAAPPRHALRRVGSDESFQCRGLSPSSSLDFQTFMEKAAGDDSKLRSQTSFSTFVSSESETSGSLQSSTSDFSSTPSSTERPLRPTTRPPSLPLEGLGLHKAVEQRGDSIAEWAESVKLTALGIYGQEPVGVLLPALYPHPLQVSESRKTSTNDGCEPASRHTPRTGSPSAAVKPVRLWVRFVGLPSDEALEYTASIASKLSTSSLRARTLPRPRRSASPAVVRRTTNAPVAPFEISPLDTISRLKERLADMVLERFGFGVTADELTVSMHSIASAAVPPPAAAAATMLVPSPTLRYGCSAASSVAGTATPNSLAAAWSSTASLPSLMQGGVGGGASGCGVSVAAAAAMRSWTMAPPPTTMVTELRDGASTLWSEGVEDGFTLVARIRALSFF